MLAQISHRWVQRRVDSVDSFEGEMEGLRFQNLLQAGNNADESRRATVVSRKPANTAKTGIASGLITLRL